MLKLKQPETSVNITEGIEQRIKVASAEISKESAEEAVSLAMRELDTKLGGSGSGTKIQQILKRAKELGDIGNNIDCPNCKNDEHSHSLKVLDNGKLKCAGEECGAEFALITTEPDYQCKECLAPHSRPKNKEDEANDSCPFCNSNEFIKPKIDYKKIRDKVAKKKKK